MTSQAASASSIALRKLAISAFALVLPTLLCNVVVPGLDQEQLRVLATDGRFPPMCSLGLMLLVPWLTASTLVAGSSGLWRLVRGRGFTRERHRRAEWLLGALFTCLQVSGVTLFFASDNYLINEPWARWSVALCVGTASLLARVMVSVVSRFGLGEGWSIMLAGELLSRVAGSLAEQREDLAELLSNQSSLELPMALLSALALTAFLANVLPFKLARAPWASFPLMPTTGLVALNLALITQMVLINPIKVVAGAGSLIALPLNVLVPPDELIALLLLGAFAVALAALRHRQAMASCKVAGLSPTAAQRWFWGSTFVTACWLLLLTHAANLSTLGKDLLSIVVILFVVRDLWRSFRLHTRSEQAVQVTRLDDASQAHAAAFLLAREQIEHVIEGAALHSLFRDFVGFADLTLVCGRADIERAQRCLLPLTGVEASASSEMH